MVCAQYHWLASKATNKSMEPKRGKSTIEAVLACEDQSVSTFHPSIISAMTELPH